MSNGATTNRRASRRRKGRLPTSTARRDLARPELAALAHVRGRRRLQRRMGRCAQLSRSRCRRPFHVTRKYRNRSGRSGPRLAGVNECSHMCHPGIPGAPGDAAHHWPGRWGTPSGPTPITAAIALSWTSTLAMPKPSHYTACNAPPWLRGIAAAGIHGGPAVVTFRPGSDWFAAALAALSDPRSWPDPRPRRNVTHRPGPTDCLSGDRPGRPSGVRGPRARRLTTSNRSHRTTRTAHHGSGPRHAARAPANEVHPCPVT